MRSHAERGNETENESSSSMVRSFMAGWVLQGDLGSRPNLRGDIRQTRVLGQQHPRLLPEVLDHPAAFAGQLVLIAADLHQSFAVFLAIGQRIGAVVLSNILAAI